MSTKIKEKAYLTWDKKEEEQIVKMYKEGKNYVEIGRQINRTAGAVMARLYKLKLIKRT